MILKPGGVSIAMALGQWQTNERKQHMSKDNSHQPLQRGDWTFHKNMLTLEFTLDRHWYEIDLEECTTPAELLDWLFQMQGKAWCTAEALYDLFEIFEEVSQHMLGTSIQGGFCPFGNAKRVEWKQPAAGRH